MPLVKFYRNNLFGGHISAVLTLLLGLFLTSCDELEIKSTEFVSRVNEPIKGYKQEKDVLYGTHRQFQVLDIYYPENAYKNPSDVLIMIHGGNWNYGDKWFLDPSVEELKKARKNLTIVNINYTLISSDSRRNLFQQQIADIDSCVSYLHRHAAKYNIRRGKFAIMGASAGGHLALSYAYTLGKNKIHTVIGTSAITELAAPELLATNLWSDIKTLTGYRDGSPDKDVLYKASPVHLAGWDSPRTVLLYGQTDDVVLLRQQTLLRERLLSLRVPNALYIVKNQGHNIESNYIAECILGALGADEWDLYVKNQ